MTDSTDEDAGRAAMGALLEHLVTEIERDEKIAAMLEAEKEDPEATFYLSFAGEEGWRGGCFVRAHGPIHAVQEAHRLGINPGGEVGIMGPGPNTIPDSWMNRLLSREEVEGSGPLGEG